MSRGEWQNEDAGTNDLTDTAPVEDGSQDIPADGSDADTQDNDTTPADGSIGCNEVGDKRCADNRHVEVCDLVGQRIFQPDHSTKNALSAFQRSG